MAGYVTYSAQSAPNGRRYLLAFLVTCDAQGRESGPREELASFPAPMHGSPWLEGVQRHARAFAFAHPATVEWVTPRDLQEADFDRALSEIGVDAPGFIPL